MLLVPAGSFLFGDNGADSNEVVDPGGRRYSQSTNPRQTLTLPTN